MTDGEALRIARALDSQPTERIIQGRPRAKRVNCGEVESLDDLKAVALAWLAPVLLEVTATQVRIFTRCTTGARGWGLGLGCPGVFPLTNRRVSPK